MRRVRLKASLHSKKQRPLSNGPTAPAPDIVVDRFEQFRDDAGRFTKGNPGGPGNPHARRAAAYRLAFACALNPEELFKLVQQMVARALAGDIAAGRYLTDRALGRVPADAADAVVQHDLPQADERFI